MSIVYRYTAEGGQFFPGIHARDLTTEDVAEMTPEQIETVEASGVYERTAQGAATPPLAPSPAAQTAPVASATSEEK